MLLAAYELYFSRLSVYSIWFVVSFASTVGAGKWGAGDSWDTINIDRDTPEDLANVANCIWERGIPKP